jgi:hypothetical protein
MLRNVVTTCGGLAGSVFPRIGVRIFLVILALAVIWVAIIVLMALIISDSPINLRG